jgi:hypothetical protein
MRETLREWRLTARAFGRGVRTTPGETYAGRADPELLALVADPYADVADARERLRALERTLYEREDGRAAFLTVYARVTEAVEGGVAESRFADPDWVARYLVAFADHYRRAFEAFERGTLANVPDPWQVAFDRACSPETLVVQDVLLGVNAHVNYDLALALHDVGIDPDRRGSALTTGPSTRRLRRSSTRNRNCSPSAMRPDWPTSTSRSGAWTRRSRCSRSGRAVDTPGAARWRSRSDRAPSDRSGGC